MKNENDMKAIGRVNSSQDGVVFSPNGISQCCSAGHGNTPKVGLTIKVKEATKQGYANALVGGGQTASICPCRRARPEGGEWVAIWQTH